MTCSEALSRRPQDMTRAERAAMFAHVMACADCTAELDSANPLPPEAQDRLTELALTDITDGEFRSVALKDQ